MATREEKESRYKELISEGKTSTQALQIADQEMGESYEGHNDYRESKQKYVPEKEEKEELEESLEEEKTEHNEYSEEKTSNVIGKFGKFLKETFKPRSKIPKTKAELKREQEIIEAQHKLRLRRIKYSQVAPARTVRKPTFRPPASFNMTKETMGMNIGFKNVKIDTSIGNIYREDSAPKYVPSTRTTPKQSSDFLGLSEFSAPKAPRTSQGNKKPVMRESVSSLVSMGSWGNIDNPVGSISPKGKKKGSGLGTERFF